MSDEIIPNKSLRKLNSIIIRNEYFRQDKILQQQIIAWAKDLMSECRNEWQMMRATTIKAIIQKDRKTEAQRKANIRDKKYAPFRKYFYQIQKNEFDKKFNEGYISTKYLNKYLAWYKFVNQKNDVNFLFNELILG